MQMKSNTDIYFKRKIQITDKLLIIAVLNAVGKITVAAEVGKPAYEGSYFDRKLYQFSS